MPGMNHTNRQNAGVPSVPPIAKDIIFLFNDTVIPSGWSRFTPPDGKRIIGAGTTYDPGDNGGANTITLSAEASDSVGSHSSGGACNGACVVSPSQGADANGAHDHDFSGSGALEPDYQQLVLIKCDNGAWELPAKTLPLWDDPGSDPTGLTQQYTGSDDTLIRAGASIDIGGTETLAGGTTTTDGNHAHPGSWSYQPGGTKVAGGAGSHSHSVTLTFTFAMKRAILGLWTNAAALFDLEAGHIAMYESVTPPIGWYLCDGNNGTTDLRDYMLGISNKANQGNTAGDNTLTATHPPYTWTHTHACNGGAQNPVGCMTGHGAYGPTHTHTLSLTDSDFFPTYHSLAFIQYGG